MFLFIPNIVQQNALQWHACAVSNDTGLLCEVYRGFCTETQKSTDSARDFELYQTMATLSIDVLCLHTD